MAAPPSPAVVAKKKQEELVKVKQEKQLEIKQEQLAANIPPAINQFVMEQRNASTGQSQQQAFQDFGPPQPPPVSSSLPSTERMRQALAQAGFPVQPLQPQAVPTYHQLPPQMISPQMQLPLQPPPQSLSPFPYQQNFIAPPLLPPLTQQQQFPPEFLPQAPSPQYSRSPTPINQSAARPMNSSLSSHLLGQISQEPKPKQRRQTAGNNSREPLQPPILPPLTTRKERKESKSKLTMVVPPPPTASLNQDIWDPMASIPQTAPLPVPVFQPQVPFKVCSMNAFLVFFCHHSISV